MDGALVKDDDRFKPDFEGQDDYSNGNGFTNGSVKRQWPNEDYGETNNQFQKNERSLNGNNEYYSNGSKCLLANLNFRPKSDEKEG